MQVDFSHPDGRDGLLDSKTKKLRNWIFDLKKRVKKNSDKFKQKVIDHKKKVIELDSIMMLNTYSAELRKNKIK